jgi:ABC-type Na+ efflux pump permease subunit
VCRIARWEVARGVGSVDRRTAAIGLVALLLAGGVGAAAVASGGASLAVDEDIYRVAVPADSPYHEVVVETSSLAVSPPGTDDADLRVRASDRVQPAPGQKGQAALAAFRAAVERHNDRQMARESNETAAYPVLVDLRYEGRGDAGGSGGVEGATGGFDTGGDGRPGGFDTGDRDDDAAGAGGTDGSRLAVPGVGGGLFGGGDSGSPADIDPPFPFGSLVLAFAFLVPMNFVIQAYGSSVLGERVNRRGELLLVSPATPGDIVAGKTAPYLAGSVLVTAAIAVAVGGGPLSVAAVVPVACCFLAATFVAAMFARSFKELTFATVSVSTFLTSYTFVPAIFTDVTPIALISPLTLVVRDLQGVPVSGVEYAFSTGPFYLAAGVLFLLGTGVYREEDMFTQRPVPLKLLDALDSRLRGVWSAATLSALFIPFVFIAELLAIAVLFALPIRVSVPLLLVVVAAVEEVAKSIHLYAGFETGRFDRSARTALVLGSLSGLGFFVGEKLTAVVQLVGLPSLQLGQAAFAPSGIGVGTAAALLLAPLALHVVTASVSALGARGNGVWYGAGLAVAIVVHAVYNLAVVVALG